MAMVGLYLYLSTARETLRMRLCLGGRLRLFCLGWQERLPLCSHVVPFAVIWLERAKKSLFAVLCSIYIVIGLGSCAQRRDGSNGTRMYFCQLL